ncbi:MAG: pilus assembly protein TadG-related protein [Lautropia sp.]|nr:pilus assembly protein TadG-related protein [Lautropia sp.]
MTPEAGAARAARSATPCRALPAGCHRAAGRQRGQALLLGMFLLVLVAMLTFFMFSAGQLTTAKRRLVNVTDAAAYSVGVWQARAMNYHAYANRAIIANEVAIAQAVTLVSYMKFIQVAVDRLEDVARYIPVFGQYVQSIERIIDMVDTVTRYVAKVEVAGRSAYIHALSASQWGMHQLASVFVSGSLATEVAKQTDGKFFVQMLSEAVMGKAGLGAEALKRQHVLHAHEGQDRERLKDLIVRSLDPYTLNRSHTTSLRVMDPLAAPRLERRGQTQMILDHDTGAFDRWQAYDTLSLHEKGRKFWRHRSHREVAALAWGGAEAARDAKEELDALDGREDGDKRTNRRAYGQASRDDFWSTELYWGLPAVYDLNQKSPEFRKNPHFPVLTFGLMGYMSDERSTQTKDGRTSLRIGTAAQIGLGGGRLQLHDRLAGRGSKAMRAISAVEIYFRRPAGSRKQYASLYSPYWQARLAPVPAAWRLSVR